MMIGIIGAMAQEVDAIKKHMKMQEEKRILDCIFYIGTMEDKEVVVLQGGIGKVNAAVCTTLLLSNFSISYIINIGSAGGLHINQNVGDIVVPTSVAYHDVDATDTLGQIPEYPAIYFPDQNLQQLAITCITDMGISAHQGLLVSGDQFIAKEEQVQTIRKNFADAICVEMEGAAIGQTCFKYQVPYVILRSLSDIYGKGDSTVQFTTYLNTASKNSALLCKNLIRLWQAK